MKKTILLTLAFVLVLSMCACKKCEHIDKDDDFLCDECGAEFDDGLEIITSTVTFELKDESGAAMAGVKFTVKNAANTYELESGADGKATVTLPVGAYEIEYDASTMPSGFQPDLHVLRVTKDTTDAAVTVVDNNPNGTKQRPYLVADDVFEIAIGAGEEIFYTCRVSDFRKMKIEGNGIVVTYDGTEYEGGEEFVIVNDTTDVNFMVIFSVKNTSDSDIETEIVTVFEPGTRENPHEFDSMSKEITLAAGQSVYYKWISTTDCVLIASKSENKCSVSLSKIKIVDGEEIPVTSATDDDGNERLAAFTGEEIIIQISNESKNPLTVTINLEARIAE